MFTIWYRTLAFSDWRRVRRARYALRERRGEFRDWSNFCIGKLSL